MKRPVHSGMLAQKALSVIKFPIYVVQLFTGAKSFNANPIIGNRILNIMGLHVVRVVLAAGVTNFRYLCLGGLLDRQQKQAFHRDGYLLIENFLAGDEFAALDSEIRQLRGEVRECVQGDTLTHRILLSHQVLQPLPSCSKLLANKRFLSLLKYTAARNCSPIFYVQSIKSNVRPGEPDPQRTLHSDTFHATMKAWLFLDDVSDRNGPFTYVPGSQRLTLKRLAWEYRNSIAGSSLKNSYAARGSLRIKEDELEQLKLGAPKSFTVPANTLVIANTNGFHRRGAANEVSNRLEVWAFSRTNPFNPLPGFNLSWYTRLSHKAIELYLRRADEKAATKGVLASWHVVDENALHAMPETAGGENVSDNSKLPEVA